MQDSYSLSQTQREVLAREIGALYKTQTDRHPRQVACKPFGNGLVIVVEGVLTHCERLLIENRKELTVRCARAALDRSLRSQIATLIETILAVRVVDMLSDTALASDCAGTIAILECH